MENAILKKEDDRRKHHRYPTSFVLDIGDLTRPNKKVSALVTDVSEGGLCLESNHKLDIGSSLTLRLELPLMVQGGVVRSDKRGSKYRYGVRFHNVRFTAQGQGFAKPRTMVRKVGIN
ncbi:MAG: PilZ domain-containing protein [Elusimicrobia bacterium]|nr:PilZ domain-containing protein [Elusimicrobiota bacterium]